jgi:DNA-binding transcriptional regulator YdaS (Cro superfamily)
MSTNNKSREALERAVQIAGSQPKLASRITEAGREVSQQTVGLWLKNGLTPGWAIWVARAVEFQVTPHELDDANYPNAWDGLPRERARPLLRKAA